MEVYFRTTKLQRLCNSERESTREWGPDNAKRLRQRLLQISAVNNLAELQSLPQARLHLLAGNRAGQYAVDLKNPWRLILEPANNPIPRRPEGGVDLAAVDKVCVLEVVDYHG